MSKLPAAGQLLRTLMSRGYSQLQELEADQEAIRLTSAAGFNAQTSVAALKRLSQVAPTHPDAESVIPPADLRACSRARKISKLSILRP